MKGPLKATWDAGLDTFRIEILLGGAAILGLLFPMKYTVMEVGVLLHLRMTTTSPLWGLVVVITCHHTHTKDPLDIFNIP